MDYQVLWNVFSGITIGLLAAIIKEVWSAIQDQRTNIASLREDLPKTYITKDDFKDAVNELKNLLIAIDAKLDRKVDKDK
jgi:hypothetical protein